jgi:hypothetical protein
MNKPVSGIRPPTQPIEDWSRTALMCHNQIPEEKICKSHIEKISTSLSGPQMIECWMIAV